MTAGTAYQNKTLTELLEGFVAETAELFPHLSDSLLIAERNLCKTFSPMPPKRKRDAVTTLNELMEDYPECGTPGSKSFLTDDPVYSFLVLDERISKAEKTNPLPLNTVKHLLFVLDHEVAHLGILDGAGRHNNETFAEHILAESVADAYAQIRHYQRFGADSTFRDTHVEVSERSRRMVMEDRKDHFTTFVLDEIIKRKDMIDFDRLTPLEAQNLARRFATQYMPPPAVIDDLNEVYKPVGKAFRKSREDGIIALAAFTLDPQRGYHGARLGTVWLAGCLEDHARNPINLPADYLSDISRQLKVLEFRLAEEDILFNMPLVSPAANCSVPPIKIKTPAMA